MGIDKEKGERSFAEGWHLLVAGAGEHLERDGWLFFELSPEQADEAERMLMQAGFEDVTRRFDLASRPRVVGARWPGEE